ncbi:hypothetical protein [Anaerotignum sp.]
MTVKQLIDALKTFDEHLECYAVDFYKIESVRIAKDIPLGDTANPNCEYADEGVVIE